MITKEELEDLYIKQNKTAKEISKIFIIKVKQIYNLIYKYNLKKPKNIKKERICPICKKAFNNNNKKYCSKECRNKKLKKIYLNICKNCGKEFIAPKCHKNQKYCCYECSRQAKCTLEIKECAYCHKKFKPRISNSKFCSKKCADKNISNVLSKSYYTFCKWCNKKFKTIPSENAKFCCRECYYNALHNGMIIANHKHGTYEEIYGEEKAEKIKAKLRMRKLSEEVREKARIFHTGKKRSKETCEKLRQLQLSKEHQAKIIATKRKNGMFNTSKVEKEIEDLLKTKFKNLKTQYSSEKYPFNCDFYIPELDLYIEYQGHWTHGKHAFLTDNNDLNLLKKWQDKSESSQFFKNAIEVWTVRDPFKRETARKNNLNWLEFFAIDEFMQWFESQN